MVQHIHTLFDLNLLFVLLNHMVKIYNMNKEEFEELLITKITPSEFNVAHPQGLFLSEVQYPFLKIAPKTSFSAFQQNGEWIKL